MSVHVIFYQDGAKHMRPVTSEAEYRQLRDTARQKQLVAQARQGDKDAKRKLLQFNYSCLPNDDGTLKGSSRLSMSVGMDVDRPLPADTYSEILNLRHPPLKGESRQPPELDWFEDVRQKIFDKKDELGLLMLERSVSKGYHLVFKRHPEMSQEDNLRWASALIGVPFDEAAKDHTRVFFTTTASEDDLLYLDEEIFTAGDPAASPPALSRREGAANARTAVNDHANSELTTSTPAISEPAISTPAPSLRERAGGEAPISTPAPSLRGRAGGEATTSYSGIPYSLLVEALAEQLGGVPVHGSRNNFIFSMACHLRYVCNDDPQWIMSVLPTYGEERSKVERTVQSAVNRAQSRNIPEIVKRAISIARTRLSVKGCMVNDLLSYSGSLSTGEGGGRGLWGEPSLPPLPSRLPRLITLLTSKVDPMYRPAVAQAVFPPLGTHLHGVRVRYIDNSETDLGGFMAICMAKQSIGKGSVNMPIDLIMEDIRQRDEYNRKQEKQWKEQYKQAKEGHKPIRPEGMCVQYLMSNMTNAALVQRLIDAEAAGDMFLYTRLDEIEMLDQIKASGGATASEIIRLAHNQALYGQERVGADSITGTPPLRFNFNASTTIPTGQRYFSKGLTNGTLSRLTLSTIIKPLGQRGIPRFGNYDEKFRQQLAPYINNLNAAHGLVECRQADRMAERLCEENADFAELSDDDAFETLSYRACRIVHDKAKLLYIANGYKWDKSIADFCKWSMQYDLWLKLHFFGEKMRQQTEESKYTSVSGPQNMLDLVPDRFSVQHLSAVYHAQGRTGDAMQLIYTWCAREYISKDDTTGEYIKTEKYLAKHKSIIS